MKCKVCGSNTAEFAKAKVMNKHQAIYHKCENCKFVFVENPYWLKESYSYAINMADTGIVSRNIGFSRLTRIIIVSFFNSNAKFLDYGGGYGLLVRLMRDVGFDFYWYDEYSQNLLARGFEVSTKYNEYEMTTAFEVF